LKKHKLQIIHATNIELEIDVCSTVYAPKDYYYLIPKDMDAQTFFRTIYDTEKEKNEWIRKYNNLLKGINFFKNRLGYK
jgi:hypothetical protein